MSYVTKEEYNSPYIAKRESLFALITTEGFLEFCEIVSKLGKVIQQYANNDKTKNIPRKIRLNINLLIKIIFITYISIFSTSNARS